MDGYSSSSSQIFYANSEKEIQNKLDLYRADLLVLNRDRDIKLKVQPKPSQVEYYRYKPTEFFVTSYIED